MVVAVLAGPVGDLDGQLRQNKGMQTLDGAHSRKQSAHLIRL